MTHVMIHLHTHLETNLDRLSDVRLICSLCNITNIWQLNDVMQLCVYLYCTCEPWLPCMAKCIPAITKLFLARCRGEPAIITREHTKPLIATYQLFTVPLSGSCWFHGYLFRWKCAGFSPRFETRTCMCARQHVHEKRAAGSWVQR